MPALLPTLIEKLQALSPEELQKALRLLEALAPAQNMHDLQADDVRPWWGIFDIESQRRGEVALPLSSAEPLPPRERPFDILWEPNRQND